MDVGTNIMCEHIPEESIDEFREIFSLFDRDGGGTIDVKELAETLKALGKTSCTLELTQLIRDIDLNGDGVIDFDEFTTLMVNKMKTTDGNEELKEAFTTMDYNGRGYITATEVYNIIIGLGEKVSMAEATEMVKAASTKHKDRVDYDDFVKLVRDLVSGR